MTHLKTLLLALGLAGCEADHARCDDDQRYSRGLCFSIDAGTDGGTDAGADATGDAGADAAAAQAQATPPGSADTPAAPRSGSGA